MKGLLSMEHEIYLDAPDLGPVEKEYLGKCIDTTFVSTAGPFVPEFEEKFARYAGVGAAVALQSGTAALHMALYALGIGPGDEVIVPALTFVATVNPVLYVGATPVIVEVDPETWNLDPGEVEKAITPKTKALIPVHLYGNPCHLDVLAAIAGKHNLYLIEDATESLGASYRGRQTGAFGDFGCFSFNGNKLITTGGGGMITTGDTGLAGQVKFLINQARDSGRGYYHPEMGFNYRMTNIEAALGLAQFTRLKDFLARKRAFNRIYREILGDLPCLKFQQEYEGAAGSYWLNCIRLENEIDLSAFTDKLARKNIPTRRIFMPLGEMPYLKKYARPSPRAREIYEKGICLPSSACNTIDTIEEVALTIRRVLVG